MLRSFRTVSFQKVVKQNMKTIIWVDKGNKNYFKMGEKPIIDTDIANFDCFEVEKLSYMEYEELKSQGHIVIYVDGKLFQSLF